MEEMEVGAGLEVEARLGLRDGMVREDTMEEMVRMEHCFMAGTAAEDREPRYLLFPGSP